MLRLKESDEHPNLRSLELVTPPIALPVSVAELKNALRIDASVTADDTLIEDSIKAATSILERTYGLALSAQTWRLWLDKWPMQKDYVSPYSGYQTKPFSLSESKALDPAVSLGVFPATAITHVKIYDGSGSSSTFSSDGYYLDSSSKASRLVLKEGLFQWPTENLRPAKAIEVEFEAGFSTVPAELKMGVLSYAMALYMSRGCGAAIPAAVQSTFLPWAAARI